MHAGQDGIEAFQRRNDGRILEIVARNRHAIDMEAYSTVLVVSDVLLVRSRCERVLDGWYLSLCVLSLLFPQPHLEWQELSTRTSGLICMTRTEQND